jgi:hypothetical protein
VGKTNPAPIPRTRPPVRLLGMKLSRRSGETRTSIVAEKRAPITRNGIASIKIDTAMAENTLNVSKDSIWCSFVPGYWVLVIKPSLKVKMSKSRRVQKLMMPINRLIIKIETVYFQSK